MNNPSARAAQCCSVFGGVEVALLGVMRCSV